MYCEDRAMPHELDVKRTADTRRFLAGIGHPGAVLIEQIRREEWHILRGRIKFLWISLLIANGHEGVGNRLDFGFAQFQSPHDARDAAQQIVAAGDGLRTGCWIASDVDTRL